MVYNIVSLIILIPFSGCNPAVNLSNKEVVEIKTDGFISERRYYNANKNLIGLVSFEKEKLGKGAPIDSVCYQITPKGELEKVLHFNYENGKYVVNNDAPILTFYETLFSNIAGCNDFKGVSNAYLLMEAMNDICIITGSVLDNGQNVAELQKTKTDSISDGLTTMISYDLNSAFIGLTEELQSYFYQQQLKELKFTIKNNFLMKEYYYFSRGTFTREYIYSKNGKLASVMISAQSNDSIIISRVFKEYSYR
jgi:hypothetical protein